MMKEAILKIVHEDAMSLMGYSSANMQRCFAIRPNVSQLLDIARQAYCELIDDMQCNYNRYNIILLYFLLIIYLRMEFFNLFYIINFYSYGSEIG